MHAVLHTSEDDYIVSENASSLQTTFIACTFTK